MKVFQRCQPQIALGMGVIWQGVSAGEVRSACLMSLVRRKDWPRYIDGVQLMAQVVAGIRNTDEEKRAKRRKKTT